MLNRKPSSTPHRRRSVYLAGATVLAMQLPGCADVAQKTYSDGWRYASVVKPHVGSEVMSNAVKDCRSAQTADTSRSSPRYALLSYSERGQGPFLFVAAVPADVVPRLDRSYQVNVNDCTSPWYR